MSTSVRDLVSSMLSEHESEAPAAQGFLPLDVGALARTLRIRERAIESAEDGLPSPDAAGPDIVELDILGEVERHARDAEEHFLRELDVCEGRIQDALRAADQAYKIDAAGQKTLADFKTALLDDENHLALLRRDMDAREQEFRAFREKSGLRRPPIIASPSRRVYGMLLLAVFVLLESILNGMFFAEGSDAGLVGGVVQALLLSLLNVGGAVAYATYALPLLFHRRLTIKVAGILLTAVFIAWVVGLNLAIGQYRDLFVAGAGSVQMAELTSRLTSAPHILNDARSGMLVLLGAAIAIAAVIEVATTNDPYPGYAVVGRERQHAVDRYIEERSRCMEAMARLRADAVEDLGSANEVIHRSERKAQAAVDTRWRLHQGYMAHLDHLATVHERLVQSYRDMNRKVRASAEPSYFRRGVERPDCLRLKTLPLIPRGAPDIRGDVIARIEHYIRVANERFDDALASYNHVPRSDTVPAAG